jgi:hypothetical protein
VAPDLREQLQSTLGTAYTLERELGGGGMARVLVDEETALGRRVVVKVLPPETAAGVNAERFRREAQLAARLHHPHVIPLLAAGERDGLLYCCTMPFVAGEGLRAARARGGAAGAGRPQAAARGRRVGGVQRGDSRAGTPSRSTSSCATTRRSRTSSILGVRV